MGAPGTTEGFEGVTALDEPEDALVPALLVAVTVNVYDVPLLNPLTAIGLDPPLPVKPPGLDVTV
jgi:hypothetical protein